MKNKKIKLKHYPCDKEPAIIAKGFKPYEVGLVIQGKNYPLWVDSIKMALSDKIITYLDLEHLSSDVVANLIQLVLVKSLPTGLSQWCNINNHNFGCVGKARDDAKRKRLLQHFNALAGMTITQVVENAKSKGYGKVRAKRYTHKEATQYLTGVDVKVLDAVMGVGFSKFFTGMSLSALAEAVHKVQSHLLKV